MFTRSFLVLVLFSILVGCPSPDPEDTSPDAGGADVSDLEVDDGDLDVPGPEDTGREDTGSEDADSEDADDDVVDNDVDAGEDEQDGDVSPALPAPWGCAPDLELDAERYAELEMLTNQPLLNALYLMTSGHTSVSYNEARDHMFGTLGPQDDGDLECIYTGRRVTPDGTRTPGGFSTEHAWPQSKGASTEPARSDLHHLFPTDSTANNSRADHEFGNVDCAPASCPWGQSGSYLGGSADDGRDPVFEVRVARRGDIARAMFYFSMRYDIDIQPGEEAVLRDWHCEDPPDDIERARNAGIEGLQMNRNPFIDRPDFVDRVANF